MVGFLRSCGIPEFGVPDMKKIILAAVAVLAISGSAFAGSDNYGSNGANQPAVSVDSTLTGAVGDTHSSAQKLYKSSGDVQQPSQGSDRNLFGH